MHTVLGFTADEWVKIIHACGPFASIVIGAVGVAYARLAAKRSKAAATGTDDAVEAAGRAEHAAASGTSDLTDEVAKLRALVTKPGAAIARAAAARPRPTLDDAAATASRAVEPAPAEPDPPARPAAAPVAPVEPSEGAGPVDDTSTPTEAPEGRAGATSAATLDTQAVWAVLGGRKP